MGDEDCEVVHLGKHDAVARAVAAGQVPAGGLSEEIFKVLVADGIGFELMAALRLLQYDQVSAILLAILACVVVVDGLGATLRRALK